MEELKAMFRVCFAIKNDGVRCGSPALPGINFCYHHIGGKVPSTRAKATTPTNAKLKLVYPGDRQAIQHNLFLVAQALNDGKIDTATANTFNRLYRTCEQNLRQWQEGRSSYAKMRPLPDETQVNNDVILSEANEPGVPADRSSSVGWKESGLEKPVLSEAKEPAVRVERHIIPSEVEEPVLSEAKEPAAQPSLNSDVILSGAKEESAVEEPVLIEAKEPAARDESSTSADGSHQTKRSDPYADLRHLPPTEFARRVFERVEQRYAERAPAGAL